MSGYFFYSHSYSRLKRYLGRAAVLYISNQCITGFAVDKDVFRLIAILRALWSGPFEYTLVDSPNLENAYEGLQVVWCHAMM